MRKLGTSEWVALILASGVSIAIIILVIGVVWSAIKHGSTAATLTENETQVIIASFSGIFGILGAFLGYYVSNGNKPKYRDGEDTAEWPVNRS